MKGMKAFKKSKIVYHCCYLIFAFLFLPQANATINIVAAENIYGNIAKELGGPYVNVTSILNNPSQDPHLFTTTPSIAQAVSHADIVIYNGADYDPWMKSLLAVEDQPKSSILNVASLMKIKTGDNPHIWYLPTTIPFFAKTLVMTFIQYDPQHRSYYEKQLNQFTQSYQIIFKTIAQLNRQYKNKPIIATEPIFNYMAESIGLQIHGKDFQINMMNDVPPTISQIKAFEDDLYHHNVEVLIYNEQVINPLTEHLRSLAEKEHIPVVGVNEMMPANMTYIHWMMQELTDLGNALANHSKDLNNNA